MDLQAPQIGYRIHYMMETDTNQRLGAAIRMRRQARGVTLEALHAATEIDVSQLSKIERGLCGMAPAQQERIARALGWSPVDLWKAAKPHARRITKPAQ